MPNWVTHRIDVSGPSDETVRFFKTCFKSLADQLADETEASPEYPPIDVIAIYPDGTAKKEVREPTGPVLDFETLIPGGGLEWGTKWNADQGQIEGDPAEGSFTMRFDTAWSVPEPIFKAIAEQYPSLTLTGYAFDELWRFAAAITVKNGSAIIEEVEPTQELYERVYGVPPDEEPDDSVVQTLSRVQENDDGAFLKLDFVPSWGPSPSSCSENEDGGEKPGRSEVSATLPRSRGSSGRTGHRGRTPDRLRVLRLLVGEQGLSSLQIKRALHLSNSRYKQVRGELLRDDLVEKYVCRGGGLQLTSQGKEVATKDWEPNKEAKENASPQYGGPAEQGTAATQSAQAISAAERNARIRVLGFLFQHGGLSHRKIKRELSISDDVYDKVRAELVAEGLVEETGKAGGGGLKLATKRKHETSSPKSIEQGPADALMYRERVVEEIPEMRRAAEEGNVNAQLFLANAASMGAFDVPQNDAEAVKWYRLAADQGDADAQFELAGQYDEGVGVPQSEAEAMKWYRLAAEQGHADAQAAWDRLEGRAAKQADVKAAQAENELPDNPDKVKPSRTSARGALLSDDVFIQLVGAAKSIAKASNKQELTPLLFLCAIILLHERATGFESSPAGENEEIVRHAAEKQGIKLSGVDVEPSDEKIPLSEDLQGILSRNLNSSVETFLKALATNVRASDDLEAGSPTQVESEATQNDASKKTSGASGGDGFWTALGKKIFHAPVGDSTGTTTTGRQESAMQTDFKEAKSFGKANPDVVRRAAEQGHAIAQNNLGIMYSSGQGVPQDDAEAAKWYRRAAEQGEAFAQYNLGIMYDTGRGVQHDDGQAAKWYHRAAEQGDPDAQFNFGNMCWTGQGVPKDERQAVEWYRRSAEQGNVNAQYNLGCMSKDQAEAVKWYLRAAEQGHADAQYNTACMYREGRGVSEDVVEAAKWYRRAAEGGITDAQYMLGTFYLGGLGVAQDYTEAAKWLRRAAEQGDAGAQFTLGVMYSQGQGVTEDKAEAVKWLRLASKQGNTYAQAALEGLASRGADTTLPDDGKKELSSTQASFEAEMSGAISGIDIPLLLETSEEGDASSQFMLGMMYARGERVPWDGAEAAKWLRRAADQGLASAQCSLALMYENGALDDRGGGVAQDYTKAAEWYRRAAEQDDAGSQFSLGRMYEKGRGVSKNEAEALKWYRLAANQGQTDAQEALQAWASGGRSR
jgi:TPR repeat protein/DNA-binding IscR family transcriptional regulator